MNPPLSARDLLAAAEATVKRTKVELEEACEQAQGLAKCRDNWLADRPDLARLDRLIKEHPCRQSQLARVQKEFHQAYEAKLCEKTRTCPFKAPAGVEDRLKHLRWLYQELK